jgi:SAM-dependent methyltransferase
LSSNESVAEARPSRSPYRYSLTTRFKDRHILELLDLRPGDRVLDAGCGSGYFVEQVARTGARPAGVDVSWRSVRFCRQHTPGLYVASAVARLPFRDSVFDKVLFTDVIEHMREDRQAVAELARVARPGASVVITTAALEGPLTGTRFNRLFHDDPSSPEFHVVDGYTADSLRAIMDAAGIEMDAVRYTTYLLSELAIEALKVAYRLAGKTLHDQTDVVAAQRGPAYAIYRWLAFPVLLGLGRTEELAMGNRPRGHIIIVRGRVGRCRV